MCSQARQHPWLSHNYDEVPVAPAPTAPVPDEAADSVTVPPSRPEADPEQAEATPLPTPAVAVPGESAQAATTATEAPPAPEPVVDKAAENLAKSAEAVEAPVATEVEAQSAVASEGGDNEAKTS